jgi:glycosyltransferase involved in cell wall biosynthesis
MPDVLIDASLIHYANTGIANVMRSLITGIEALPDSSLNYKILVPHNHGFSDKKHISYVPVRRWQKIIPYSLPRVDVWHSTYQCFRFLRKPQNTRQIITIHDLNFLYEKNARKAQYHLNRLQQRINQADAIVSISQFVADDIKKNLVLDNKPLEVIYNCVENLQQHVANKPSFVTSDAPFFFALGAIRKKKNIHSLLEVMLRFPDHQLYIAGNLDNPDYLLQLQQQIATLRLTNVHITGPVSTAEKVWLYQHAEALLFPSRLEGFGLPVLEAMQFGTPVFISNMTSLPEVAGGHAFIWESFDPDYMAESLLENLPIMHSNTAQRDAMKNYATSFSLEKNIQQHLSLYHRLAGTSITEA